MAGIDIISGFNANAAEPADRKRNVQTIAERDALPQKFHGMDVFVRDLDQRFELESDLVTWRVIGSGSGGGSFPQVEGRTVYVSVTGNNSTGETGNPSLPFQTLSAAYAHAITLTPTSSNPVTLILYSGVGYGDLILTNSFINIISLSVQQELLNPNDAGLSSSYTQGTLPSPAGLAIGGWTSFLSFGNYTGETFTIGSETWTGVTPYVNAPFTFDGDDLFGHLDTLISNFNANNTQGFIMHYNLGNINVDSGSYTFGNEGVTVVSDGTESDFTSKNGVVLSFSDNSGNLLGSQISPTSGGSNPQPFTPGVGTPSISRNNAKLGNITINNGVQCLLQGLDVNSLYLTGVVTGCNFSNILCYSEIASDSDEGNTWLDCHAPSFLESVTTIGSYTKCSGIDYAFSGSNKLSTLPSADGTYTDCYANNFAFGFNSSNAVFTSCFGNDYCFGRAELNSSHSSTYVRCFGNNYCWNSENIINCIIDSCTANDFSFAYTTSDMPTLITNGITDINIESTNFKDCVGNSKCFIVSDGTAFSQAFVGQSLFIESCQATQNSFFTVIGAGEVRKFTTRPSFITDCKTSVIGGSAFSFLSVQGSGELNIRALTATNCRCPNENGFGAFSGAAVGVLTSINFFDCEANASFVNSSDGSNLSFNAVIYDSCRGVNSFFNFSGRTFTLFLQNSELINCSSTRIFGIELPLVTLNGSGLTVNNIKQIDFTVGLFYNNSSMNPFPFKIENTTHIVDPSEPFEAIRLADGAVVKRCTFKRGTATESITASAGTNANITYSEYDVISPNITNEITTPFNIDDSNVK